MPPRAPRRHGRRLGPRAAAAALAATLAAAAPLHAQLRDGFRDTLAPRGDDTATPFAELGFAAHIRGGTYTAASACTNGYLSLAALPDPAACDYPGEAGAPATLGHLADRYGTAAVALFADLDATPPSAGRLGYGPGTVDGRRAFGFTWDGLLTFGTAAPAFAQLVFVDRSPDAAAGDFDLEFNYGALPPGALAAAAGTADDGGFSGARYTAAVAPAPNARAVQCFRGGSARAQGCATPAVVPEPAPLAVTALGLGALAGTAGRRRAA
jgi:hypothetical protein